MANTFFSQDTEILKNVSLTIHVALHDTNPLTEIGIICTRASLAH